ncbi:MAG: hypothetical protein E7658_01715 [Ruminococcaceae bacterium]|nr:hypothetical protein [Oscillospiraceae bacterium]
MAVVEVDEQTEPVPAMDRRRAVTGVLSEPADFFCDAGIGIFCFSACPKLSCGIQIRSANSIEGGKEY